MNAFTIDADAKLGKAECASDEITRPDALILTPGSTWKMDGFVCQLDQRDLTCLNSKRHGFSVSKSRQRVFWRGLFMRDGAVAARVVSRGACHHADASMVAMPSASEVVESQAWWLLNQS